MPALEIRHLTRRYGERAAVDDVSFSVGEGELVCVVGPSGCGKTTILRCAAGLLTPSGGRIAIAGRVVFSANPKIAVKRTPYLRDGLLHSVELGLGAALVSIALATPAAISIERTDMPFRIAFDFLILLPFTTPPFLSAEAWILILQRHGYLQQVTGLDATSAQRFLFSYYGIVFVMALHLFPLVYFAQRAGLSLISSGVIEAARASGAGWLRTGIRILLPLMLPATLAGALLVFAAGMAEFGAPAEFAIQAHFFPTSVNIATLTSQYPTNRPQAAALSVILMTATFLAVMAARAVVAGRRYSGRSITSTTLSLGRGRWPAFVLVAVLILISAGIPWGAVIATSVLRTLSGGLAWSNVSPHRLLTLLSQPGAVNALRTSLTLAAVAATAVAVLGTAIGYLITRPSLRGRWLLDGIATLPVATPGVVIAVAVIVVWNQPFMPGGIYESQWVLAIAYTIVFLPFGVRYSTSAFQALPPGLDEAGRTSGAGLLRRMVRLTLPLIAPAVLSAWALAFAIGMRELENSLIVRPPGTVTVSYFMWQSFTQGNPLSGIAMAVVTLVVTSIALLAVRGLAGRVSVGV